MRTQSSHPKSPARLLSLQILGLTLLAASSCGGAQGTANGGQPGTGPTVSSVGQPPTGLGLLGGAVIRWRSNESGTYTANIGPAGGGSSTLVENGTVVGNDTVETAVSPELLDLLGASVVHIEVTNAAGNRGSLDVPVSIGAESFEIGVGAFQDVAYDATRESVVVTNPDSGVVLRIDVDASRPTYGTTTGSLPSGPDVGPYRVALTADGQRGLLLYRSSMLEIDLALGLIENTLPFAGSFDPSGLTTTPGSDRAYVGYIQTLLFYDVGSAPPAMESTGIMNALVLGGDAAVTPDGAQALYAWFGATTRGLWVIDSNASSPGYNTLLAEHLADSPPPPPVMGFVPPKVGVAPSGLAAYTGALAGVAKIDLQSPTFPVAAANSSVSFEGLLVVNDGSADFVIVWDRAGDMTVLDADLAVLAQIGVSDFLADRGAYDPTGQRIFLLRDVQGAKTELVIVPLF